MITTEQIYSIIVMTPDVTAGSQWLPKMDQVVHQRPFKSIWSQLRVEAPDAIIALCCDQAHVQFFATLHDTYTAQERPAIILCVNEAPDDRCVRLVDAILPQIDHALVPFQIRQAIHQKRQHAETRSHLENLEAANRDLRRKQAARSRSIDEVEVLKNTIVRNVTHELSTPLLQVKSAVALIGEDMQNNNLVEYATRATGRLEAVVKSITQLATSLDDIHISPLIVRECVDSALRDLRRTWEYKNQIKRISVTIEPNLPLALADRQGITTVLQQLIDNALKFSEGPVEVTAIRQADTVLISVRDVGIGIAPDQRTAIFESFYQVDASNRRNYGGMGVGLAVVRLILDRHNVEIHLQTELGKGSTFSFALPIAALNPV